MVVEPCDRRRRRRCRAGGKRHARRARRGRRRCNAQQRRPFERWGRGRARDPRRRISDGNRRDPGERERRADRSERRRRRRRRRGKRRRGYRERRAPGTDRQCERRRRRRRVADPGPGRIPRRTPRPRWGWRRGLHPPLHVRRDDEHERRCTRCHAPRQAMRTTQPTARGDRPSTFAGSLPGAGGASSCSPQLTVTKTTATPDVTNTPSGTTADVHDRCRQLGREGRSGAGRTLRRSSGRAHLRLQRSRHPGRWRHARPRGESLGGSDFAELG